MSKVVSVVSDKSIPFNVRLVEKGDKYGVADCLTHTMDEPIVEFYDARYPHTHDEQGNLGQFISRYNWSIIDCCKGGINLHGDEPDWSINEETLQYAKSQFGYVTLPLEWTIDTRKTPHGVWRAETVIPLKEEDDHTLVLTVGTQKRFGGHITTTATVGRQSKVNIGWTETAIFQDFSKTLKMFYNVKIASQNNVVKCHEESLKMIPIIMGAIKHQYSL